MPVSVGCLVPMPGPSVRRPNRFCVQLKRLCIPRQTPSGTDMPRSTSRGTLKLSSAEKRGGAVSVLFTFKDYHAVIVI